MMGTVMGMVIIRATMMGMVMVMVMMRRVTTPISIHLDRLLQPNSRQLAATRDDIHQHWWRHSPSCMGIALVQIQLENSAFFLKQHHFL